MDPEQFKKRTKAFALDIVRLVENLPNTLVANTFARQLVRCATSVAANYRAACRSKSRAHFISKMGDVEEEADESMLWLEMILDAKLLPPSDIEPLHSEANEILSMVVSSITTAKRNR